MVLVLITIGLSIGIAFYLSQSVGQEKKVIVDVLDVVDNQTLTVNSGGVRSRVILAGIGYPAGDDKAKYDAFEIVKDVCLGKRLYMAICKEAGDLKYVNIMSGSDESLNELLLRKGFARYNSVGVGQIPSLVAAESEAKINRVGIWDKNREFYMNAQGSSSQDIDHLDDATMASGSDHS